MYLELCQTTWKLARISFLSDRLKNLKLRRARSDLILSMLNFFAYFQAFKAPKLQVLKMPKKQSSISSFFKPKTSTTNVQKNVLQPKKEVLKNETTKIKPEEKENVEETVKKVQNVQIHSDSDEEMIPKNSKKSRRSKILDSSDDDEPVKPAKKKQK